MTEIVFQHGWALTADIWHPLVGSLRARSISFKEQLADRGYFGSPVALGGFSQSATSRVVVAHSFGLHLVPREVLASANAVVLLAAFINFHVSDDREAALSRRMTTRMIKRFKQEPEAVLREFYANCSGAKPNGCDAGFDPGPGLPSGDQIQSPSLRNDALLLSDLERLAADEFDYKLLEGVENIHILHGIDDHIVSTEHAYTLKAHLPAACVSIVSTADHLLPLAAVEETVDAIESALSAAVR